MEIYCVSCQKYAADNEDSNIRKTKQDILMFLSNYDACGKKKLNITKIKKLPSFD